MKFRVFAVLAGFFVFAQKAYAVSDEALLAYEQGDYVTAKVLLSPYARGGEPLAQYFLGYMAYMGFAQPQDKQQAALWFRKAAQNGHPDSNYALGLLARDEPGAGVDRKQAQYYFSQAAKLGHKAAKQLLEKDKK